MEVGGQQRHLAEWLGTVPMEGWEEQQLGPGG